MSRPRTTTSKLSRRGPQTMHERDRNKPVLEPFWISIRTTMHLLNSSRSDVNRKMKDGRLRWCKDGARTKVNYQSAKALATDPASS